ncbi:hypothetical protein [Phenylobacterium sp.]|jgi:hypothetical protein|uniref:hypothetical protein n=1 Tax=Phenylobacterium sp. TaxID=1871053 RepID=UPI002F3EC320
MSERKFIVGQTEPANIGFSISAEAAERWGDPDAPHTVRLTRNGVSHTWLDIRAERLPGGELRVSLSPVPPEVQAAMAPKPKPKPPPGPAIDLDAAASANLTVGGLRRYEDYKSELYAAGNDPGDIDDTLSGFIWSEIEDDE